MLPGFGAVAGIVKTSGSRGEDSSAWGVGCFAVGR